MKDPSSDFKDDFDGLFQGAMAALNGSNDMPWRCLALIWHPILSWQLPTPAQTFLSPLDDGSSQWLQICSWRAVPGCHDSSKWFKRHTLTLSCFNMTSHSQLTIANSGSSFLPPLDDGSSKWLQRCSWRVVSGRNGGSEWFKWYTLMLSCLDMTFHS